MFLMIQQEIHKLTEQQATVSNIFIFSAVRPFECLGLSEVNRTSVFCCWNADACLAEISRERKGESLSPLQPIAAQRPLGHHQHLQRHPLHHLQVHLDPFPAHSCTQVIPQRDYSH